MRTRIGPFTLEQATDPRDLSRENITAVIRPPLEAAAHLRRLIIDDDQNRGGQARPDDRAAGPNRPGDEAELWWLWWMETRGWSPWPSPISSRKRLQPRKVLIS